MREELDRVFETGSWMDVFDRWLGLRGCPPDEYVGPMVEVFRSHSPDLHLFADARWALSHLRLDFRLGLLTDGRPQSQRSKIKALGIEDSFEAIVVTDEISIAHRKPNPAAFELLMGRMGVASGHTLYVGDNPLKDFFGAKMLGMKTVRIRRPCGRHRNVEAPTPEHAPHTEIATLFELPQVIARLFSIR
jgi:putative hydrolase of the HAD superfamily